MKVGAHRNQNEEPAIINLMDALRQSLSEAKNNRRRSRAIRKAGGHHRKAVAGRVRQKAG